MTSSKIQDLVETAARAAAERGEGADEVLLAIQSVLKLGNVAVGVDVDEAQLEEEVCDLVQSAERELRRGGGDPDHLEAAIHALHCAIDNLPSEGKITDRDAAAMALGVFALGGA